jgi:hypothetical protein
MGIMDRREGPLSPVAERNLPKNRLFWPFYNRFSGIRDVAFLSRIKKSLKTKKFLTLRRNFLIFGSASTKG